jgi:hypothetical protein
MKKDQVIFIDNFKPVKQGFRTIHQNFPKPITDIKNLYVLSDELGEYVKTNIGIIYHRHSCYDKTSPYGWKLLHKSFILDQFKKDKPYSQFDTSISAVTLLHSVKCNKIETNERNIGNLILAYEDTIFDIYKEYGKLDKIQQVYSLFENYGVIPE